MGQFGRALNLTVSVVSPTEKSPSIIKWLIVGFSVIVMIVLAFLVSAIFMAGLGPVGFGLGMLTALLPLPVYLAIILWLDRVIGQLLGAYSRLPAC